MSSAGIGTADFFFCNIYRFFCWIHRLFVNSTDEAVKSTDMSVRIADFKNLLSLFHQLASVDSTVFFLRVLGKRTNNNWSILCVVIAPVKRRNQEKTSSFGKENDFFSIKSCVDAHLHSFDGQNYEI